MQQPKPRVLISSCLLGNNVRFNGGHKHHSLCNNELGQYLDLIPYCPEMEIGLGVPRKPIRLVKDGDTVEARETDNAQINHSEALQSKAQEALKLAPISGFIGANNSPSCATLSSKIYSSSGHPIGKGPGIFAASLHESKPELPLEEAGRLNNIAIRESFITRVYTYQSWQQLIQTGLTSRKLVAFHSEHKYLLMCHHYETYKSLGRLVANINKSHLHQQGNAYFCSLMEALSYKPTRGQQCNTLLHIMGYLKRDLCKEDKQELFEYIDQFRNGIVPIIVPISMLKHHLGKHKENLHYILSQRYLNPYPYQLGLRSHIA